MSILRRGSGVRLLVVILAMVLAIAACGGDDSTESTGTDDGTTDAEETTEGSEESSSDTDEAEPASDAAEGSEAPNGGEPVTIVMAHFEGPGPGETIEALVAEYQELNPNVTIELQFSPFPDYQANIRLQASSDSAPDIIEAGQGHTMQAPLVEAGLLLPLDEFAEQYGWGDLVPGALASQNSVADDGKTFGTGSLYAMPLGGNMVGLFYNQAMLDELGIEAPFETMADFEAAMQTAADAGLVPVQLGDLGGGPASHNSGALFARFVGADGVREWIFGTEGASIDTPEAREALATMQRWSEEGFVNDDATGTAYQDAVARFQNGDSPFIIGGSWLQVGIDDTVGEDARFQLLPPVNAGDPPQAPGGLNGTFGISSKSDHPDVAADIINFMVNGGNAELLASGGFLPLEPLDLEPTGKSLDSMLEAWYDMNANDGMSLYLDWATPSMGATAYFTGLQELIAGRVSPEDVLADMQSNWEEFYGQ